MAQSEAPHPAGATVLIPLKRLALAKTRLRPKVEGVEDLVLAMALDVAAAALGCPAATATVIITDDARAAAACRALGAEVVPDPGGGLNAALARTADALQVAGPQLVVAVAGDCPCIGPLDLARLIGACRQHRRRTFVSDAHGAGTTALAAPAGAPLDPRFGAGSRQAHLDSGAVPLEGLRWEPMRRDVDDEPDLREAIRLGVGEHTGRWLAQRRLGAATPPPVRVDPDANRTDPARPRPAPG